MGAAAIAAGFEHSLAVVSVNVAPAAVSVSPNSGSGISRTFTFAYSDADGFTDLRDVEAGFDLRSPENISNNCNVSYRPSTNLLYLRSGAILTAVTPGSGTAENSQCILNGAGSSTSGFGQALAVSFSLTFKNAFAGPKDIYMRALDTGSLDSGWQTVGSWTVPAASSNAPAADLVSPRSGSGTTGLFTFQYADADGFAKITGAQALFNSGPSATNGCAVLFDKASNSFLLANDAGTEWITPGVMAGTTGTTENKQCKLSGAKSTVSGFGNSLTVVLNLTFKTAALAGDKKIYMKADAGGLTSGEWLERGSWTVR